MAGIKSYGNTFKIIRTAKNFNQSAVHKDIMHQTSYSKFELGKIEVAFNKFEKLLDNIEMSFDEFNFIHHSYNYSPRNSIINKFNNLKFIDETVLEELISASMLYLNEKEDPQIRDILNVSHALASLKKDNDFEKAKLYADKVWQRLQQLNTWYLSEIKLINSILFLFPIETAISITNFAIEQGNKYEKYNNYKQLVLPFKYNLVHLLIKEGYFEKAYKLNERIIGEFKEQKSYTMIALSYLRKGLIGEKLMLPSDIDYVDKANNISLALGDLDLQRQLASEEDYLKNLLNEVRF